jgi:hypothetical protein
MIGNPFLYRAADTRSGSMAEDRNFVNLFASSALDLIKEEMEGKELWELPLLLISAPGGGKSSLMRIFSASSMRYIQETISINPNIQSLAKKMEELGAFKDGQPYALGIWIRMSDEYQSLSEHNGAIKHGLFCAMLNSRIIMSVLQGICQLNGLHIKNDLARITLSFKPIKNNDINRAWTQWGDKKGVVFFKKAADLEGELCDMLDDPFWDGDTKKLSHSGLWSIELLANLEIMVDDKIFPCKPLIMLDDVHELSNEQIKYLFSLIMSRQLSLPLWVSLRKQAIDLEKLITEKLEKGIEKGRDYYLIDLEKSNRKNFKSIVLNIAELRVKSVRDKIGGLSEDFVNFISDEREEILLEKLDEEVASKIKDKILKIADTEINKFRKLINDVEEQSSQPHDLCRRLRMLEILVQREMNRSQKSFSFCEISNEDFQKHESKNEIISAGELFLANEYDLPYYFGSHRLIALSSFNIQQFLKLAGALFEESMTAIRLNRDKESLLSPIIQHKIITAKAKEFFNGIPATVRYGNIVKRFINAIADMCKEETYRPTAPYAPGVTGTAITMHEFENLVKLSKKDNKAFELYQIIESAVAHNILEPAPTKCKGTDFLVLYLNRLLCAHFNLPLQKGGFREKKLSIFFNWINNTGQKKLYD